MKKTLLFLGVLLFATTLFSQKVTCYDTPDGTDYQPWTNWSYKDIILDENTVLDSVIGYFDRPSYPESGKDWICSITQLSDNQGIPTWSYNNVDTSLYDYWIDLTDLAYEGSIAIKVGLPTNAGAIWDSVCIATKSISKIYDSISVTDTLIIDVSITGLNEPYNDNTIKVYPNPSSDIVFINTGDNYSNMSGYTIKIVDEMMKTVFEQNCNQELFEINISEFGAKGIYFVQIIDNDSKVIDIRKIILQ